MQKPATAKQLIADKVRQLASMAAESHRDQVAMLEKEILQLLSQQMSADAAPTVVTRSSGADSVEKCPVCMIRSLRPTPDTQSISADNTVIRCYRCGSCGHEEWRLT